MSWVFWGFWSLNLVQILMVLFISLDAGASLEPPAQRPEPKTAKPRHTRRKVFLKLFMLILLDCSAMR